MKANLKAALTRAIVAALVFVALAPLLPAEAGGTVGSGSPGDCDEPHLDAALGGGGSVTFDCGAGPVIITLTSEKTITQTTTLDGGGKITLLGNGSVRLFSVSGGVGLSLKNLTLSNGHALQGAAVFNNGQLTIANSTLFNNQAPGGVGGAIYNKGVVTITGSTLSNNQAGAGLGGAIDNENTGTLTISDSTFSGNFGGMAGGAITSNGTLSIRNTSFDNNQAAVAGAIDNFGPLTISGGTFISNTANSGLGGGIYNGGALTITAGSFISNSASGGGGLFNSQTAVLTGSRFAGNNGGAGQPGGAIYNDIASQLTVETSTLANNSANLGGGIYNKGQLTVTADTFSGNSAPGGLGGGINSEDPGSLTVSDSTFSGNAGGLAGGGIVASGDVTVTSSTIASNTSGGLINGGVHAVIVKNTVVAGNTPANCTGAITSLGHNLESANTCGFGAGGDQHDTNPLVGPLADNGGPTLTRALLPGSPAINTGTNLGCPATDQRGVPRPQFGTCDIGAYEFVLRVWLPLARR